MPGVSGLSRNLPVQLSAIGRTQSGKLSVLVLRSFGVDALFNEDEFFLAGFLFAALAVVLVLVLVFAFRGRFTALQRLGTGALILIALTVVGLLILRLGTGLLRRRVGVLVHFASVVVGVSKEPLAAGAAERSLPRLPSQAGLKKSGQATIFGLA